ncbi:hypothetical protein [Chondromyces crocatus]|uniref:hypothetical protein n=1 Tax=Chondromyces crocatus TaxID=52 RepID=UPI0012E2C604|nr:hypothetical protein [Chondromyces crocatus]
MMRFSSTDREKINRLEHDPSSTPLYEHLRDCLVWPDEEPPFISKDGFLLLGSLWAIRGFIHRGLSPDNWDHKPLVYQKIWQDALDDVPQWPGFKRLEISDVDREFMRQAEIDEF